MKVLIIESSRPLRKQLAGLAASVAENEIFIIENEATNLPDQLEIIRPDILILDILMFGKEGIPLLRQISEILPETVTIVTTNFVLQAFRKRCISAGAQFFLDKHHELRQIPEILGNISCMKLIDKAV